MNIIATPKLKFEKAVKKCAVSPLKLSFIQIHFFVLRLRLTLRIPTV